MNEVEGVIRYRLEHTEEALPAWATTDTLDRWFRVCRAHGVIGQHPDRYAGYAYGNISQRAPAGFLISATQTGGLPGLGSESVAWVRACDVSANRVQASGPAPPSSEALTHAQVYRLSPRIGFVIHVHAPDLWHAAARLGLPVSDPAIEQGTVEMAAAVQELFPADPALPAAFAMGGHEDGIVVFGADADSTGNCLVDLLARAGPASPG